MRHQSITTRASALWAKGGGHFIVALVFLAIAAPSVVAIVFGGASWSD